MNGMTIDIRLYRLTKVNPLIPNEISRVIVAAADEKQAREIANSSTEEEGYYWTDGTLVYCEEIGTASEGVSGCLVMERQ